MAFISNYDKDEQVTVIVEDEGDKYFLKLSSDRPWIYDTSQNGQKDRLMIDNSWKDIAKVLDVRAEDCIATWVRLKSNYSQEIRARKKETVCGSAAQSRRKPFQLFDQMKSMLESGQCRMNTYSNVAPPSDVRPTKCYTPGQTRTKKKIKQSSIIESHINKASADSNSILEILQSHVKNEENQGMNIFTNPDKLFGSLVAAELSYMEEDRAKSKYKKIMRYLSELED